MGGFKFSADRLKLSGNTSTSSIPLIAPSPASPVNSTAQTLVKNDYYTITQQPSTTATDSEYTIWESEQDVSTDLSIRIRITESHIRIYEVIYSSSSSSEVAAFEYQPNEFHLIPQVAIVCTPSSTGIVNPVGLVIVDTISGMFCYIEDLYTANSLNWQAGTPGEEPDGIHRLQLKLSYGEFITMARYAGSFVGVLLVTNYRQVLQISLADAFERPRIQQRLVCGPLSLLRYLRSRNYLVQNYDSSNKVISLPILNISDILTRVLVLEEQGHVTVVDFVSGTGPVIRIRASLTDLLPTMLSSQKFKFKDSVLYNDGNSLLVLAVDVKEGSIYLLGLSIDTQNAVLQLTSVRKLSSLTTTDLYPSLYCVHLLDTSALSLRCLIHSDHSLLLCDIDTVDDNRQTDSLAPLWEDFVRLRQEVRVLGTNPKSPSFLSSQSATVRILTSTGVFAVNMLHQGMQISLEYYMQQRIWAVLHLVKLGQASSSISNLSLAVSDSALPTSGSTVEKAVLDVCNSLVNIPDAKVSPASLARRYQQLVALSQYVTSNLQVSDDVKLVIVNSSEEVGLAWQLITVKPFEPQKMTNVQDHPVDSLQSQLSHCLSNNQLSESSLAKFAANINTVLRIGYMNSEEKMRSEILQAHYTHHSPKPVFYDHPQLLKDVNSLISRLSLSYGSQLDTLADANKDINVDPLLESVSQSLLGLSLFCYYVCNDLLLYQAASSTSSGEDLSKYYDKNRPHWIQIFIILGRQNQLLPIAQSFEDLPSLCELLDSHRIFLESPNAAASMGPIELSNAAAELDAKFNGYFQSYGYTFAKTLFQYYVNTGHIDVLLTRFSSYPQYLETFLKSNKEFATFSWIPDLAKGNNLKAGQTLLGYVRLKSSEKPATLLLDNERLQLSIAKLATYAGMHRDNNTVLEDDGTYLEVGQRWIVADVQHKYYQSIMDLANNLHPSHYLTKYGLPSLSKYVESELLSTFIKGESLTLSDFVTFLTLSNCSDFQLSSYEDALKLLSDIQQLYRSKRSNSTVLPDRDFTTFVLTTLFYLVLKRIILSENWDNILSHKDLKSSIFLSVLSNIADYTISPPSSVSQLLISRKDLKDLNVDDRYIDDYMKENNALTELDTKVHLDKWLGACY